MKAHDIYDRITNSIVSKLKEGARPWVQPWGNGSTPLPLRSNGIPYQGINTLILWLQSSESGYANPTWMTYKQAQGLDAQVKKGEKGTRIVFASSFSKTVEDASGEEQERKINYLKTYTVFNVEQIEGLGDEFLQPQAPPLDEDQRIEACEQFFDSLTFDLRLGGHSAYYKPSLDYIQMPPFESFHQVEGYYGTLAHEAMHWTGHKSRMDRSFVPVQVDPEGYAFEELVAEIGSAFVCSKLGLEHEVRDDHVSYIEHWLPLLQADNRAIFKAASLAQKASDFLFHESSIIKEKVAV